MKNTVILLYGFVMGLFFYGCSEVTDWQPRTDSIAPGTISNIQVENLAGAAKITYDLPDDEDLLAIEAVYTINGKKHSTSASAYTNSLTVEGFGSTEAQTIQLFSVDRSNNYSPAIDVDIHPLTPAVISIFESIKMSATFGGASYQWENPTEADVSIWLLASDTSGTVKEVETVYTRVASGEYKLRGFDAVENVFGVYVRDRWNNLSDTLYASLTPYYEEKIDSKLFKRLALPRDENDSGGTFFRLTDGDLTTGFFTDATVAQSPVFFTIDLGQKVTLSRYKLWYRLNTQYASVSPKLWKVYGALNPDFNNTDTDYWVSGYQKDWILLSDVSNISQYKPSGLESENTAEDKEAASNGFDFEFLSMQPVRYIRFEINENWATPIRTVIGELEIYGATIE